MNEDPWKDIAVPAGIDAFSAKRVDPDVAWDFFWGRAVDRSCLFVLSHSASTAPMGRLPKLKGVEVNDVGRGLGPDRMLIFKLIDTAHRDIFERLCRDIVAIAGRAQSEKEAVGLALARTWRWHHLLRGGSDGLLSVEEQKGLVGELLLIYQHLMQCLSPREILDSWRGPLDSPKDFEIGRVCVEVKTRRGAASPHIAINSADQLDTAGVDDLFLSVVELDQAPVGTAGSFTVTDLAKRVRDRLLSTDGSVGEQFDQLLEAAGFDWFDDYSGSIFIEGAGSVFRVGDGFPRLCSSKMPSGIRNVKYSVALQDCMPFSAPPGGLIDALRARKNVDRA